MNKLRIVKQKVKNALKMMNKLKTFISWTLVLLMLVSCTATKSQSLNEAYEIINLYYGPSKQSELGNKTVGINQYTNSLENISVWQEANMDLGNSSNPKVDFESIFKPDEFASIIEEFMNKKPVRLKRKMLDRNIRLRPKAKNLISFPHVFTKNNTDYALMYVEITEGPENAAGGVVLFRKENGTWKEIFYLHLWIS